MCSSILVAANASPHSPWTRKAGIPPVTALQVAMSRLPPLLRLSFGPTSYGRALGKITLRRGESVRNFARPSPPKNGLTATLAPIVRCKKCHIHVVHGKISLAPHTVLIFVDCAHVLQEIRADRFVPVHRFTGNLGERPTCTAGCGRRMPGPGSTPVIGPSRVASACRPSGRPGEPVAGGVGAFRVGHC